MAVDPKTEAAQAIENAMGELDKALFELHRIPTLDATAVGFVAHAMNNYLAVTEATLDLLKHALRGQSDREVTVWLEGLGHIANLMHHSVGRLIWTSAQDDFPLKPEAVNLALLMQRACDYYRRAASRKQLEIVCRSVGDVPPAWADRVAVAVVADNLLSNAVKFSNPGGDIQVQIMPGPGGVVCSVRDHGPGLSLLEQAQLFKGGKTLGAVPTAGERSTGFGLAVAKEFIDRMGGRLWCESEPGNGACFFFRLPYNA